MGASSEAKRQHCRVAVRVRPPNRVDELTVAGPAPIAWSASENTVTLLQAGQRFNFDHVYGPDSPQPDVFEGCCAPLLQSFFNGFNCCILAYGQTGSGKTYTVGSGPHLMQPHDPDAGIIPRAAAVMFAMLRERQDRGIDIDLNVNFIEIYNEELRDLLDPGGVASSSWSSRGAVGKPIRITEDPLTGAICIVGARSVPISSQQDLLDCLARGGVCRMTASNNLNTCSSRSHAIFTISMVSRSAESDGMISAKFHFVDLAGSERIKRTQASGDRLKEGISINAGLLALSNVINALTTEIESGSLAHVPYRDSKLTRILQDSLGGNSQTLMIACVSASPSDFAETLSTIKYATRARNIQNIPIVNRDAHSVLVEGYQQQIHELTIQLLALKKEAAARFDGNLSEQEQRDMKTLCRLLAQHEQREASLFSICETLRTVLLSSQNISNSTSESPPPPARDEHDGTGKSESLVNSLNTEKKPSFPLTTVDNALKLLADLKATPITAAVADPADDLPCSLSHRTSLHSGGLLKLRKSLCMDPLETLLPGYRDPTAYLPMLTDMRKQISQLGEQLNAAIEQRDSLKQQILAGAKHQSTAAREASLQTKYHDEAKKLTRQVAKLMKKTQDSDKEICTLQRNLEAMRTERLRAKKKLQEQEMQFRTLISKKEAMVALMKKREAESSNMAKRKEQHQKKLIDRLQKENDELTRKLKTMDVATQSRSQTSTHTGRRHAGRSKCMDSNTPLDAKSLETTVTELRRCIDVACRWEALQRQISSLQEHLAELRSEIMQREVERETMSPNAAEALYCLQQEQSLCASLLMSLETEKKDVEAEALAAGGGPMPYSSYLERWMRERVEGSDIDAPDLQTVMFDEVVRLMSGAEQLKTRTTQLDTALADLRVLYQQGLQRLQMMETYHEVHSNVYVGRQLQVQRLDLLEKSAAETSECLRWCLQQLQKQPRPSRRLRTRSRITTRLGRYRKRVLETGQSRFDPVSIAAILQGNATEGWVSQYELPKGVPKNTDTSALKKRLMFQESLLSTQEEQLRLLEARADRLQRVEELLSHLPPLLPLSTDDVETQVPCSPRESPDTTSPHVGTPTHSSPKSQSSQDASKVMVSRLAPNLLTESAAKTVESPSTVVVDGVRFIKNLEPSQQETHPTTTSVTKPLPRKTSSAGQPTDSIPSRTSRTMTADNSSVRTSSRPPSRAQNRKTSCRRSGSAVRTASNSATSVTNRVKDQPARFSAVDNPLPPRRSTRSSKGQTLPHPVDKKEVVVSSVPASLPSKTGMRGEQTNGQMSVHEPIAAIDAASEQEFSQTLSHVPHKSNMHNDIHELLIENFSIFWNTESFPHGGCFSLADASELLTISSAGAIALWDTETTCRGAGVEKSSSLPLRTYKLPEANHCTPGVCAFPGKRYIAYNGDTIALVDPQMDVHGIYAVIARTTCFLESVRAACLIPSGSSGALSGRLAVASRDTIRIYDLRLTSRPLAVAATFTPCPQNYLSFHHEFEQEESFNGLAGGGADRLVRFWKNSDSSQVLTPESTTPLAGMVHFGSPSRLAVASVASVLSIWDTAASPVPQLVGIHKMQEVRGTTALCTGLCPTVQAMTLLTVGSSSGTLAFYAAKCDNPKRSKKGDTPPNEVNNELEPVHVLSYRNEQSENNPRTNTIR